MSSSDGALSVRQVAALVLVGIVCWLIAATPAAGDVQAPASGTLDLAAPDQSGAKITMGAQAVAFVGDVNGDGIGDVAIGAPTADPRGRRDAGSIFVVFGRRGFSGTVDPAAPGSRGYRIDGGAAGARLGTSIAALGDIDGDADKLADFAIGAPQAGAGERGAAGVVYLMLGSKARGDTDLRDEDDKAIVRLLGVAAGDGTGSSLAPLGSPTPGGPGGLVIGAPTAAPKARSAAGSVYVLPGPLPTRGSAALDGLAPTSYRIDGRVAGGQAGSAVGTSPDISGDGLPEVLLGAPFEGPDSPTTYAGAAFVVTARPLGASVDLAAPTGEGMVIVGGAGMGLGASIAGIGDLSGDGVPDIAVGAPTASPDGRAGAGSTFVVRGRTSSPLPIVLPATPGSAVRLDGISPSDRFGSNLAVANVDDDAYRDLLVSAPNVDALGRTDAGAVYELLGSHVRTGLVDIALLGRSGVRLAGTGVDERSGTALAADFDAGGDARSDVLVGSRSSSSLLDLPVVPRPPATIGGRDAAGCSLARDVELVVDDSAPMRSADPQLLRRTAIEALITKLRTAEIRLGAIEIGARAMQVFPTLTVGARGLADQRELATLRALLDEHIRNDAGPADYAAGLGAAVRARPQTTALVLITDGSAPLPPAPLPQQGPRVYVLQLRSGLAASAAPQLGELARATGGQFLGSLDAASLPAALAIAEAGLNCEQALTTKVSTTKDDEPPATAPAPPDGTPTTAQEVIATSTLTRTKPKTSFDTGLAKQTKTATMTLAVEQPPRPERAKRSRPTRCVDASAVSLRGMRFFAGRRLASRATRSQLRSALSGRPTKIGKLRAWGRCGRGYLTLRISGLEHIPATGAGALAAVNLPTRAIKALVNLGKGHGERKASIVWVSSVKKTSNTNTSKKKRSKPKKGGRKP